MGKKSKTIEAISKVMFDPNVDPGNIDLIFLDSGEYREVPFNFLKFIQEGFYYDEAFIPGYKIHALRNRDAKEFLVNRGFDKEKLVSHKWPDIPPFPFPLKTYVNASKLYRYAAYFIRAIRKKLCNGKKQEKISTYFGQNDQLSLNGSHINLIYEKGPFQNTVITKQNIYRGLPTALKIEKAKSFYPEHCQVLIFEGKTYFSLTELKNTLVKISNGSISHPPNIPFSHPDQQIVHYIEQDEQVKCIGYTNQSTYRFKFFRKTLESMERVQKERLSSIGWRHEGKVYFLHDFDFIPLQP